MNWRGEVRTRIRCEVASFRQTNVSPTVSIVTDGPSKRTLIEHPLTGGGDCPYWTHEETGLLRTPFVYIYKCGIMEVFQTQRMRAPRERRKPPQRTRPNGVRRASNEIATGTHPSWTAYDRISRRSLCRTRTSRTVWSTATCVCPRRSR